MRSRYWIVLAGLSLLGTGCAQDPATAPETTSAAAPEAHMFRTARGLKVLSQNIYVGADVDAIIAALSTPGQADDIAALQKQVGILHETDFPTRADALADLLARERPEVVGLSEVSIINIDLPALGLVYQVDFLAEIERALAEHHLPYRVAAKIRNFEAKPMTGISLVDYTLALVDRHRVKVGRDVVAQLFSANVGRVVEGVVLTYGFVTLPITVAGQHYRVATTHLQADVGGVKLDLLRGAQMQELLASIGNARHAVILGDLNDFVGKPMYQLALAGGFTDVWAELRPGTDGFTCCHSDNLTDARILNQRIDYIFTRGFDRKGDPVDGFIRLLGVLPGEQFPGPVHPIYLSDHAGLVATLVAPRGGWW